MNTITKILWAVLAGIVMLWVGGGTPLEATNEVCYEQVDQAQYKKFTAPTNAGPFDKAYPNTWWKGQANTWHADVGEIAEGPGPHPDGSYVYRRTAQRTVNGDVITCPTTTTSTTTTQPTTTTTVAETTTTQPETATSYTMAPPLCLVGQPSLVDGVWTCPDPGEPTIPTPTTNPPTTLPPRVGDVCYQHITGGPTLTAGNFVTYGELVPEATGSTNIGVAYCGPIVETSPTTVAAVVPTTAVNLDGATLPATGTSNWLIAGIATLMLGLGASATWVARR